MPEKLKQDIRNTLNYAKHSSSWDYALAWIQGIQQACVRLGFTLMIEYNFLNGYDMEVKSVSYMNEIIWRCQ